MERETVTEPAVAVFEGVDVPRSSRPPAHALIRFLLETVIARASA
ncbi:hypothetical protein [Streptomyces olivaceoviridis]|nr:hypothetical protein [Streptomyces olivaceoviridis]